MLNGVGTTPVGSSLDGCGLIFHGAHSPASNSAHSDALDCWTSPMTSKGVQLAVDQPNDIRRGAAHGVVAAGRLAMGPAWLNPCT